MFTYHWDFFKISWFCTLFLYWFVLIVENIFGTTNPFIYEKKNFDINSTKPKNKSPDSLKSHNNVKLEVFAKSAAFRGGDALKCLLFYKYIINLVSWIYGFQLNYVIACRHLWWMDISRDERFILCSDMETKTFRH